MIQSLTRWQVVSSDEEKARFLAQQLDVSIYMAKLLLNRGIDTLEKAKKFLFIEDVDYYDPFLLGDMDKAAARIKKAIKDKEHILIFGDYDADGVSSTAIMINTLKTLGARFSYYIPNRFTEGYGPNEAAFRKAHEDGVSLIVTVDTGIAAINEAEILKELGIDYIITDHHEVPPVLPDAYAIINPKKTDCPYPFKGLAGVGVAFKVAHALLGAPPKEWLDIVAIGTVADLVPLLDENRLLVKEGIRALQMSTKPGIQAIKKVCGIFNEEITSDYIGFTIGPRINAAGRLGSAIPALKLLTTDDENEAKMLAEQLEALNRKRQVLVNDLANEAILQVEQQYPLDENYVLVIGGEHWNEGVIGIVASRLVERFRRPTIVFSFDSINGVAKGSARSIEGFDIYSYLLKNKDLLTHFGGHPMAAGLSMPLHNVNELRKRLNNEAREVLTEDDFKPKTKIDAIIDIKDITVEFIKEIERLAPYGTDNPSPTFMLKDVFIHEMRKVGTEENHLKISFTENNCILDSVGFQKGYLYEELTPIAKVSAVGKLAINQWNGYQKPQLFLEDLAVREWQLYDWRSQQKIAERISDIQEDKRLLICFREETISALQLHKFRDEIIIANQTPSLFKDFRYVIFLDLPEEMEQIERILGKMKQIERIYLVFYHHDSYFFRVQPNREQFKWYYAFLRQRETFNVEKFGHELANYKKWAKETIEFMTKVFLELDFVTMKDGIVTINPSPKKKELTESPTYKKRLELIQMEKTFLYSSYQELKNFFGKLIEKKVKESV